MLTYNVIKLNQKEAIKIKSYLTENLQLVSDLIITFIFLIYVKRNQINLLDKMVEQSLRDIIIKYDDSKIKKEIYDTLIKRITEKKLTSTNKFKNHVENIIKYTQLEIDTNTIIKFIFERKLDFLLELESVYNEQLKELKRNNEKCDNFYVSIYDGKMMVISFFVFVIKEMKSQIHLFIAKNIKYVLIKYINKEAELKNASILLHSFASYFFEMDAWMTKPYQIMIDILNANKIPATCIEMEKISEDPKIKNIFTTLLSQKPECWPTDKFEQIKGKFCIVNTNDMKDIWLSKQSIKDITKEKLSNDEIVFIIKNKTGEDVRTKTYFYNKYRKYKTKFLVLKNYLMENEKLKK